MSRFDERDSDLRFWLPPAAHVSDWPLWLTRIAHDGTRSIISASPIWPMFRSDIESDFDRRRSRRLPPSELRTPRK
jgi:hypothetical protein